MHELCYHQQLICFRFVCVLTDLMSLVYSASQEEGSGGRATDLGPLQIQPEGALMMTHYQYYIVFDRS